jgi:hypothetical protein
VPRCNLSLHFVCCREDLVIDISWPPTSLPLSLSLSLSRGRSLCSH